jgi:hypothetical protein
MAKGGNGFAAQVTSRVVDRTGPNRLESGFEAAPKAFII